VLKHEEDARKVHPEASDFRPVLSGLPLARQVIGWTFNVPRNPDVEYSHDGYSWVDLSGDVPSDTYGTEHAAASVMKSHLRQKRQAPVNELEKRA
jgi:hypothetical protein